jgi:hypothetical protein
MRILKYESFLETMQFAALTNAQKLAKQEEERRKSKREEEDSKKDIPAENRDNPTFHSDEEMETEGEEPQMETEEGQEPEGESDFRKIMVPGTDMNLDEFEKKLGQPITQYELSKDGKEVTMVNRRPIDEVIREEFPEGEEEFPEGEEEFPEGE